MPKSKISTFKKQLLILVVTILSINSYAQIQFEKGYYIDNFNKKIDCQIRNVDWRDNPTEFEYRLSASDETQKAPIKLVKEFGIDNRSKYVRKTIDIDRSSDDINKLSNNVNSIFKKEELFLRVLLQGKTTLFEYIDGNLRRYFYEDEELNTEQLIFKRYKSVENGIQRNNGFREQLWDNVKCSNVKISDLQSIEYKKSDLVNFFLEQAQCNDNEVVYKEQKQKRDLFNLTLRPRLNSSSLLYKNSDKDRVFDFGNKTTFAFGIEAEFILPFNKNEWSILIEPIFQHFKSRDLFEVDNVIGGEMLVTVNYRSVEIPITLRRYFFLNKNSKLFLNASFIIDSNSQSYIEFARNDGSFLNSFEVRTPVNFAVGLGYKQNDRISIEIRQQTNRNLIKDYFHSLANYKTASIILGYSFF